MRTLSFGLMVVMMAGCSGNKSQATATLASTQTVSVRSIEAVELDEMVKDGRIKDYVDTEVEITGNLVKAAESQMSQTDKRAVLFLVASKSKVQKESVCEVFFETKDSFNTLFRKWLLTIKDNKTVRVKGKLYISNVSGNVAIWNAELLEY